MTPGVLRQLVSMNVQVSLTYRASMLLYMVSTVFGPVVALFVWLTVSEQGVALPYSRDQFVTYYLLLSFVSMITGTWLAEYVAEHIRLGSLSPWLLRPAPFIAHDIGNNIGEKVVKLPLLLPLVGIVALLFRDDLRLPADPVAWLGFGLALVPAAAIAFLLDFVLGSLAFWIEDVRGLIRVKNLVGAFLAGRFLPLALFPAAARGLLEAQPFRYTVSFPLEVLTGHLAPDALAHGFAWAIGYCVGLWACYRVIWHFGLRSYTASGA